MIKTEIKIDLWAGVSEWVEAGLRAEASVEVKSSYFKGILHFFLEIGSFYHSLRVKQLTFTVFKTIQPIFWYLEEYQ